MIRFNQNPITILDVSMPFYWSVRNCDTINFKKYTISTWRPASFYFAVFRKGKIND